jgi:hypothetical protein
MPVVYQLIQRMDVLLRILCPTEEGKKKNEQAKKSFFHDAISLSKFIQLLFLKRF